MFLRSKTSRACSARSAIEAADKPNMLGDVESVSFEKMAAINQNAYGRV